MFSKSWHIPNSIFFGTQKETAATARFKTAAETRWFVVRLLVRTSKDTTGWLQLLFGRVLAMDKKSWLFMGFSWDYHGIFMGFPWTKNAVGFDVLVLLICSNGKKTSRIRRDLQLEVDITGLIWMEFTLGSQHRVDKPCFWPTKVLDWQFTHGF